MEKEKNIKILFCVESGSRVWRLDSQDSDYDIRFVFVRPLDEYIKIIKSDDVISVHFDKNDNKVQAEGCYLDFCGFDIFKFSKMLSASNPTVIEWLTSDIEYYGKKSDVWKEYALNYFNPISLYHHYKSMCRQNYIKYLKSGNEVTYKKYLYAMRGLLNAKWVYSHQTIPPIDFTTTITNINNMPSFIINKLKGIIKLKKQKKEKDIIQNIVKIDEYIEGFLKVDDDIIGKKYVTNDMLNEELQRYVLG